MIWEEMDYNKPKLTMTQRLSYEREPELFDIKGEDNYNEPDEPSVFRCFLNSFTILFLFLFALIIRPNRIQLQ